MLYFEDEELPAPHCLINSYSSFRSLFKAHFPSEAFHDLRKYSTFLQVHTYLSQPAHVIDIVHL